MNFGDSPTLKPVQISGKKNCRIERISLFVFEAVSQIKHKLLVKLTHFVYSQLHSTTFIREGIFYLSTIIDKRKRTVPSPLKYVACFTS